MRIFVCIFMILPLLSSAQELEKIKKEAVLNAHTDFTDFSLPDIDGIDNIISQYEIKELKGEVGLINCYFFEISPLYCQNCESCRMLIVYWKDGRRFFRLKGFRYNEFTQFFNFVLLENYSYLNNKLIKNTNKTREFIFKEFFIENYELEELYEIYYNKKGKVSIDANSCFFQSRIRIY